MSIPDLYTRVLRGYFVSNEQSTKKERVARKMQLINEVLPEAYHGFRNPTESFYDGLILNWMESVAHRKELPVESLVAKLSARYHKADRSESSAALKRAKLFNRTTDLDRMESFVRTLYAEEIRTDARPSGLLIKEYPVAQGTNLSDAARIALAKGTRANIKIETENGEVWRPAKDIAAGCNPETGEYNSGSGVSFTDARATTISTASYMTVGACAENLKDPYRSTKGGLELLHLPSKNNECLTAIFRNAAKDSKYCKTISRELGLSPGPKGPEDIAKLCAHYDLYVRVFAEGSCATPIATYGNESRPATVDILFSNNHYTRILSGTPQAGAIQHIQAEQARKDFEFIVCNSDIIQDPQTNDFGPIIETVASSESDYFISGPAGVGKSFLLTGIARTLRSTGCAVFITASTGVAAVRIGGTTIHSFILRHKMGDKTLMQYAKCQGDRAVIIDECGMLSAVDMGDFIAYLRENGFRLIVAADECQIPPVDHGESIGYFFQCDEFQDFKRISLTKVRRTENVDFAAVCLKIRVGIFDDPVKQFLGSVPNVEEGKIVLNQETDLYIAHRNDVVDSFNEARFRENPNEVMKFYPKLPPNAPKWLVEKKKEKRVIFLKKGCRVVITKNHKLDDGCTRLYNGMLGTVVDFTSSGLPVVKFDTKRQWESSCVVSYISNKRNSMKTKKGVEKIEVLYLPVRLAYALTIHKAQGATVEGRLFFNLKFCEYLGATEKLGLFYTGISRITDPKNLFFVNKHYLRYTIMQLDRTIELWINGHSVPSQSEIAACYALGETVDYSILEGSKLEEIMPKQILPACPDTVIYYDCETAKKENGQIEPYLCSMLVENARAGTKSERIFCDIPNSPAPMICVNSVSDAVLNTIASICADFERESVKMLPRKKGKKYGDIDRGKIYRDMVKNITRRCPRLCAYNGSSFDLYFLFNKILPSARWFPKDHYVPLIILKSSKIISLRIINKKFGFPVLMSHDLVQIAPMTLADACKSFLPGEPAKIDFHDQIMTLSNIRYSDGPNGLAGKPYSEWTVEREYKIKSFPPTLVKGDEGVRMMQERVGRFKPSDVIEYCCRDTDVLCRLYHAENEAVRALSEGHEQDKLGVFDFLTCGSLTWSNFLRDAQQMISGEGNRKLYAVNAPMNDFIRKSIYGGRSLPRITYGSGEMVYLDISAMYASIMTNNKFPFGLPEWIDQTKANELVNRVAEWALNRPLASKWELPHFFIARIEYEERQTSLEPVIPVKTKEGTKYVLERRTAIITSLDVALIVAKGGRIHGVKEMLSFPYSDYLCRPWVSKCVEGKKKYGKSALGIFYKLLGNAAYGQQLKRDHLNHWAICTKPDETEQFLKRYEWDSYLSVGDVDILYGHDKHAKKRYLSSRAPYIGSFVLAYSRLMLQHIIGVINPEEDPKLQPALGDTDSLLVPISALGRLMDAGIVPKPGEAVLPGMMADEIADTVLNSRYIPESEKPKYRGKYWIVRKWFSPAPKVLAVECVDPVNGDLYYKFRAKGVSANSALGGRNRSEGSSSYKNGLLCSAKTLFDSLDSHKILEEAYCKGEEAEVSGFEYDLGETLQKVGPNRVPVEERLRANSAFTIKAVEMKRCILKSIWKGRHHIGEGITVPYGWKK